MVGEGFLSAVKYYGSLVCAGVSGYDPVLGGWRR